MTEIEPGGEIHADHPFATSEADRIPVRRLRGRLAAPVTLWTAPGEPPAGLTVASTLVVDGEPGRIFGVIDPEADLYEAITEAGVFTVQVLPPAYQELADRFAGVAPAPGGLFRGGEQWRETAWGPVLADVTTWAGCRFTGARGAGWGHLVEGVIQDVALGEAPAPLLYHRGRYRQLR